VHLADSVKVALHVWKVRAVPQASAAVVVALVAEASVVVVVDLEVAAAGVARGRMEDDMREFTRREIVCSQSGKTLWPITLFIAVVLVTLSVPAALPASQQTFASPAEAVQALVSAAKRNDTEQVKRILGPEASLLSSGDPVADKNDRDRVLKKYEEMNRLVVEPDKSVMLYVGAENWPFPIPLVEKNGVWSFDTNAGKKEILFRRIGRNEFATIDTLNALVEAQKEYASSPRDGVKQYAQKFLSDEGRHNGLFWKSAPGEPQSPIGPLIVNAAGEGYSKSKEGPTAFHGYIYRIIQAQGNSAPGGAMNYMSNGNMTRGFAILAYPVKYRNSGVMTFIVGSDGKVYQKDLGPRTSAIAKAMKQYNPDRTWTLAED